MGHRQGRRKREELLSLKKPSDKDCYFFDDFLCVLSVRPSRNIVGCSGCPVFKKWYASMEEEDMRNDREVEYLQKYGYEAWDRLSDVEKELVRNGCY